MAKTRSEEERGVHHTACSSGNTRLGGDAARSDVEIRQVPRPPFSAEEDKSQIDPSINQKVWERGSSIRRIRSPSGDEVRRWLVEAEPRPIVCCVCKKKTIRRDPSGQAYSIDRKRVASCCVYEDSCYCTSKQSREQLNFYRLRT